MLRTKHEAHDRSKAGSAQYPDNEQVRDGCLERSVEFGYALLAHNGLAQLFAQYGKAVDVCLEAGTRDHAVRLDGLSALSHSDNQFHAAIGQCRRFNGTSNHEFSLTH